MWVSQLGLIVNGNSFTQTNSYPPQPSTFSYMLSGDSLTIAFTSLSDHGYAAITIPNMPPQTNAPF
jgi:hypothetical protein